MATRNTPVDQPEPAAADAGAQQADDAEQSVQAATSGARMPSISSMIRYMAPDAIAERRRKARENFGRVTPLPNGVAEVADDSSKVAADAPPAARVSAPSPWARSRDGEIDKAALPSATMPIVPPTSSDVAGPEERDDAAPRARDRRHTWLIVAICAAVAVVGPILMILVGRTRRPVEEGRGAATASVQAAATATPSASAPTPAASALPSSPSAEAPAAPDGSAPPVAITSPERSIPTPPRKAAPSPAPAPPPRAVPTAQPTAVPADTALPPPTPPTASAPTMWFP